MGPGMFKGPADSVPARWGYPVVYLRALVVIKIPRVPIKTAPGKNARGGYTKLNAYYLQTERPVSSQSALGYSSQQASLEPLGKKIV